MVVSGGEAARRRQRWRQQQQQLLLRPGPFLGASKVTFFFKDFPFLNGNDLVPVFLARSSGPRLSSPPLPPRHASRSHLIWMGPRLTQSFPGTNLAKAGRPRPRPAGRPSKMARLIVDARSDDGWGRFGASNFHKSWKRSPSSASFFAYPRTPAERRLT